MGLKDRSRKRFVIDVSHANCNGEFVYSVGHYLPLGPRRSSGDYNLVVVPLSDGIMTSIDKEGFDIAMDTEGSLILTRRDRRVQLVFDYERGFMTGVIGGALYDTFEAPRNERTDYHG